MLRQHLLTPRQTDGLRLTDAGGGLHCGVARFYRQAYQGSLVSGWLPTLDGVADRVSFSEAKATDYASQDCDLICFFECLHDMGHPDRALRLAAESGTHVLGAQAGEARLAALVRANGFSRFRRATQTPFNLIQEARR